MSENTVKSALAAYDAIVESVGGCGDGYCLVERPIGMHTNGGCRCNEDRRKSTRMMRAGQDLRASISTYISDLEARLEKAEAERAIDKDTIRHHALVICNARNDALDEAVLVIKARMELYPDMAQRNALRECISSIRSLKDKS